MIPSPMPREAMLWPERYPFDTDVAAQSRKEFSDWSECLRCGMSFGLGGIDPVPVPVDDHVSLFFLCSRCWVVLTPEQRLPYALQLLAVWGAGFHTTDLVVSALRNGELPRRTHSGELGGDGP